MKYKKLRMTMLLLLIGLGRLYAQEAIPASGGEANGIGGAASYTIGQVAYTTILGAASLAQGVQQPYEISTSVGIEESAISLVFSVYPNPTMGQLTLEMENNNYASLSYQIYDLQGKLIGENELTSNRTSIPMENLSSSTYFLRVVSNQNLLKTFKIIKR